MTEHKYGHKGHIVDAFIAHVKCMTVEDWENLCPASEVAEIKIASSTYNATGRDVEDAARISVGDEIASDAGYAACSNAVSDWHRNKKLYNIKVVDSNTISIAAPMPAMTTSWLAGTKASWYAVNEIQGSDIIRERKQQFFFLPMFGFADEQAVLNILKDK